MEEQKYLRIIEKRGKAFIVDVNGNALQPAEAQKLGDAVVITAQSKSYVYIGKGERNDVFKIGRTEDLDRRKCELGIEFVHTFECELYGDNSSVKLEAVLHKFFEEERQDGEWFRLSDADFYVIRRVEKVSNRIEFLQQALSISIRILDDVPDAAELQYWMDAATCLIRGLIPFSSTEGIMIFFVLYKRYEGLVEINDIPGLNKLFGIVGLLKNCLWRESDLLAQTKPQDKESK